MLYACNVTACPIKMHALNFDDFYVCWVGTLETAGRIIRGGSHDTDGHGDLDRDTQLTTV